MLLALLLVFYQSIPVTYPTSELTSAIMTGNPSLSTCRWGDRDDGGLWSMCFTTGQPGYAHCDWGLREEPLTTPTRWAVGCADNRPWPDVGFSCNVDLYPVLARWWCRRDHTGRQWYGSLPTGY